MTTTGLTRNNPDSRAKSDARRRGAVTRMVQAGASLGQAAKVAGVTRSTVDRWIVAAEQGDPDLAPWYDQVLEAMADQCIEFMEILRKAANKDWRAAAFLAERIQPDMFGRTSPKVQIDQSKTTFTAEFVTNIRTSGARIDDLDKLVMIGKGPAMLVEDDR